MYYLPADSAVSRVLGRAPDGWDVHAYLISDVFHALSGKPHPGRPKSTPGRPSRYADLRRRLEQQRARLASTPTPEDV